MMPFSLIVKPATIHVICFVAITHGRVIGQLNVINEFLDGDLTENVYMTQSQGFVHSNYSHHMCKLSKPLYGLK